MHAEMRYEYTILMAKPENQIPVRRPRWEDNIVTDLINVLPGNNYVNTVQHATMEEPVFSV
jgi:hypothetical protein